MRGTRTLFSPYGGTHDEAPKRKNIAPLALYNAYLRLRLKSHIFQYDGAICKQGATRTFFYMMEQFDSMGVPGHFPILWLH